MTSAQFKDLVLAYLDGLTSDGRAKVDRLFMDGPLEAVAIVRREHNRVSKESFWEEGGEFHHATQGR